MRCVDPDDFGAQGQIFLTTKAWCGLLIRVVHTAVDFETMAQRLYRKLVAMLVDKCVLYFFRRVKYASNFFRMASSS
jgi:hypothetical protein